MTETFDSVPLRRVARVINGGTPTPDEGNWGGAYPWATPVDLARHDAGVVGTTDRTLTAKGIPASGSVPPESVVLSTRAPIGYVARTQSQMAFNQGCKGLIVHGIDDRFLTYHLWASRDSLQALGTGSTFMELGNESLLGFGVPLPPLAVQRRIADFLDDQTTRIDKIITARQQQIELLQTLWREEMRQHVAGGWDSDEVGPSEPAWIGGQHPEGGCRPLSRLCVLQRGVDLTEDERRPGPYPVVTTAGVVGTHDHFVVDGPSVVIGRYGSVGNVHWIESPTWPHNTTLYVRDFRGNDRRWVYYLLQTYPYEMLQARSAVPGINRNDMAGDLMPWLPFALQQQAARRLDQLGRDFEGAERLLRDSLNALTELKRSLISAAVSGEFGVSSADGSQVMA